VQLVSLYGTAYDLEDGALTGEALRWSSSLDGDLGTGEGISTVDLSTGRHVITLRVTDSDGMVGEATREIEVITGGLEDKAVFMPIALRFFE
jgi:chitinase